ncbi:MAG TPA: hypothetical protein VGC19_13180 [Rhodanobacter sp.]
MAQEISLSHAHQRGTRNGDDAHIMCMPAADRTWFSFPWRQWIQRAAGCARKRADGEVEGVDRSKRNGEVSKRANPGLPSSRPTRV